MTADTLVVEPAPDRLAASPQRRRRHGLMVARDCGLGLLGLLGWQLLADGPLAGRHLIASPTGILDAIGHHQTLYWRALTATLGEAGQGFLWGNVVAVALAALVAVLPGLERLVLRLALVVFCLPFVALGPLLRLFFGAGEGPQITLAALAVYYTTLVQLIVGLRAVPAAWPDLIASYGRDRWTVLTVVRARACVPYFATGLQVAVPAAILGALVGEFTGAGRGLGVLTIETLRNLDTDGLWALATISSAASVLGYLLFGWIGRMLTAEQPPLLMSAPPAQQRTAGRGVRLARASVETVLTAAAALLAWAGLIRLFGLSPFVAKSPEDIWSFLFTDQDASQNRQVILDALGNTVRSVVPGYAAGLLVGVGLAAAFHVSEPVRRVITPIAVALRCVPIVAIAPLLVAALGRGFGGTVVVVALMTFFPTLVACSQGLRQAPGQVLDFFASYAAHPGRVLASAELPAMVPAFFAAARIAVPTSILAATVAEWLATGTGIGTLMVNSAIESNYLTLWSSVALLTIIAVLCYAAVSVVERAVLSRVAPEQVSW